MTNQSASRYQETLHSLPYGSSTNSKAARSPEVEPSVVARAKGCRLWDLDGREFIDFRNGLGPITLGYGFPAVDAAIREQLGNGIVFSHPHRLEGEVAELVCDLIPCAEMARFLKTGGEANAACFRLARAFTGRDHIVQIGYNGWLNTLAAGGMYRPGVALEGMPKGVPADVARLHHACGWNQIERLRELFAAYPGQIAAVAVAASYADMAAGNTFYPALRELTEAEGALLVYDEIVTGFRVATGGVQEYFGVTPDLAVFAKGIANGMPLSVYCGRRDVMELCGPGGGVTISSTYGGEALSLAAAKVVMGVYRDERVCAYLWRQGETMWGGLNAVFAEHGVPLAMKGFWPCPQLVALPGAPADLTSRFLTAAFAHGVALYGVSYVNFSHADADLAEALDRLALAVRSLA
jgi:glutamate-1-semialdehyde 2,1-aminomutase